MATGDIGCAFHFRNDSRVRTASGRLNDTPAKATADNTLDSDRFVKADFTPCVMDSQTSTDPRTGRAAIHFPFCKDTHVAAMGALFLGRTDENGAVKKTEICFKGVRNWPTGYDGAFDGHPLFDERPKVLRAAAHPNRFSLYKGIKCAAIGNVVTYFTEARYVDRFIQNQDNGTLWK